MFAPRYPMSAIWMARAVNAKTIVGTDHDANGGMLRRVAMMRRHATTDTPIAHLAIIPGLQSGLWHPAFCLGEAASYHFAAEIPIYCATFRRASATRPRLIMALTIRPI